LTLNRKEPPVSAFTNRILHGDCIVALRSLPDSCVDFVLTDPPYLTNYRPRDGRRVGNDHDDGWLLPAFREIHRVLKPDSLCLSFYGWPMVDRFMGAWKACGFRPVSHLVWTKPYPSRDGYTQSFHEVAFLLAKGRPPKPTSPPPDVLPWEYTENRYHPTEKPVSGLVPLIMAFSAPGDLVLDPFAGSGSTGLAARQCGRTFLLIEQEAGCYHTACQRLQSA